jgi:hypothetical protein
MPISCKLCSKYALLCSVLCRVSFVFGGLCSLAHAATQSLNATLALPNTGQHDAADCDLLLAACEVMLKWASRSSEAADVKDQQLLRRCAEYAEQVSAGVDASGTLWCFLSAVFPIVILPQPSQLTSESLTTRPRSKMQRSALLLPE